MIFFCEYSLSYSSFYEFPLKSAKNFITEANPLKAHSIAIMLAPQYLPQNTWDNTHPMTLMMIMKMVMMLLLVLLMMMVRMIRMMTTLSNKTSCILVRLPYHHHPSASPMIHLYAWHWSVEVAKYKSFVHG